MGIKNAVARKLYRLLSERYDAQGAFYFEMWIRTYGENGARKTWCDMGIHFINPDLGKRDDLLIGVEVKNWENPVPRHVVLEEFNGYKHQFDLFFLAAPEFGPSADEIDEKWLGRIEMGDPYEIIEQPTIQPTYHYQRKEFIRRIHENWRDKKDQLEQRYPDLMYELRGVPEEPTDRPAGQLGLEDVV